MWCVADHSLCHPPWTSPSALQRRQAPPGLGMVKSLLCEELSQSLKLPGFPVAPCYKQQLPDHSGKEASLRLGDRSISRLNPQWAKIVSGRGQRELGSASRTHTLPRACSLPPQPDSLPCVCMYQWEVAPVPSTLPAYGKPGVPQGLGRE